MHGQQHPDLEQLDRLRAGLLDDRPQLKAVLERHVDACPVCRERSNWQSLHPGALGPDLDTGGLQRSLLSARQRAMQVGPAPQRRGFAPYATAALLLLAVSIGVWTLKTDNGDLPQQMAARNAGDIPDIYEDLDFYLWLANQKETGNGDENGDPNNT